MVDRDWRISIHEASHACIARVLKLPRCGAAFVDEPDAHAEFPVDHGAASICALMAGAAAETILLGNFDEVGFTTDREKLNYWIERHGCDGETLWDHTLAMVRENIRCIEFIAGMLSRHRVLDGPSIDRVVATARIRPLSWRG
jgi:hypothetical protein